MQQWLHPAAQAAPGAQAPAACSFYLSQKSPLFAHGVKRRCFSCNLCIYAI